MAGRRFWRGFAVLAGAGAIGVAGLLPIGIPQALQQMESFGIGPPPPLPVLALLISFQPLLLVAVSVAVGLRLAPRAGLRSHLAAWATGTGREGVGAVGGGPGGTGAGPGDGAEGGFRRELPVAFAVGAGTALAVAALDALYQPWLAAAGVPLPGVLEGRTWAMTVAGILYGGITEELLLRWGVMTFFAWLGSRWAGGRGGRPGPGVMASAVGLAALLFGVGHLPAIAASGIPITAPVFMRTVGLNGIAGLSFGWLFWRHSLEAAMVAHATVHVAWTVLSWFL